MTSVLTDDERDRLTGRDEDPFFDRKSSRIQPAKLGRSLSAFGNTDGGELAIGIEDDGSWIGFEKIEDANDIVNFAAQVLPPGYFQVDFLTHPNETGIVVLISIRRTPGVCATLSGEVFVRRAASSTPVKGEDLEALKRAKGVVSYENQALLFPPIEISNSEKCLEFCLSIVPLVEPERFLRKQGLINREGNPTAAGTLLFHEEPQIYLAKSGVKIYRYKTTGQPERKYLDGVPETVDGCLYDQIFSAVERTRQIVDSIPIMTGGGMKKVEYPPEALHEILTNAVLHRDYGINDDVHIRIFDNRVEVDSPGRLPAHVTPQNILDERFARNPTIVRLINRFPDPPNMDVGEGLNTAFRAMEALRLQRPEIREFGDRVVVTIRHETLASPEQVIVEYATENGSINNSEARKITGIEQERTIRRIFENLVSTGELVREGAARGTRYRLP
ncbi:ATP-binding protein [Amycolatopsis sp. Hca4]|uniref:ATP-binding protein n=1 Tax=Amycolatopsis sp. Hca4 TaxID=2742131 RepID=UPI001590055E|nr:ATP-binding protein [Amycolatopsis sp. Hca4]QKV77262.1 putative DNA binding domain-containing protein [Amycolatopsis sp. Hca4]